MSDYRAALPHLAQAIAEQLPHPLQRCFPRVSPQEIEDAVQEALLVLTQDAARPDSVSQRAWRKDGAAGVARVARRVAWRAVRGQLRRKGYGPLPLRDELRGASSTPHDQLLAERMEAALPAQVETAARLFSTASPQALRAALWQSFEGGMPDLQVAAQHGLRREPLSRARSWLRQRLSA